MAVFRGDNHSAIGGEGCKARLPGRETAYLVQALSLGLMFQHMFTPDEITPELVVKAFELLAGPGK